MLWSLHAVVIASAEEITQTLDLNRLIQEALENNPEIQAVQRRWEAGKAVIPQVQTLPDPRTTFGYTDVDEREGMYGLSQEIPFPGKLRLRGEVATREAERLEQEYLAARLRIIARLKEAYYDLHLSISP
jgi:outer membrane protein TolC